MRARAVFLLMILMFFSVFSVKTYFSEAADQSCREGMPTSFFGSEILRFAVSVFALTDTAETDLFTRWVNSESKTSVELGLSARTKGIAFVLSGGLRQEHRSWAIERPDKKLPGISRFVTTRYELFQEGGLNPQTTIFEADYEARKLRRIRRLPSLIGTEEVISEWTIPEGVFYEDPLVVLFNIRQGRRHLVMGEEAIIKTFPFDGDNDPYDIIRIYRGFNEENPALFLVSAPSGFLRSDRRILVKVWFDKATITPLRAVAEKVVPMPFPFSDGDASGSLVCFGDTIHPEIK
ncbi:MAG: hypothetical protein AAB527_03855 [Patescibacteria group bacterium]